MRLVIPSMGRCGSSMLFRLCTDLNKQQKIYERVGKSHSLPSAFKSNDKAVFLFANPEDIIVSLLAFQRTGQKHPETDLKGNEFLRQHAKNMGVTPWRNNQHLERMCEEDIFHLEKQFDAWMEPQQKFSVLLAKYPNIWKHQEEIGEFLQFKNFSLPKYKERMAKTFEISSDDRDQIRKTYKSLIVKVERAKDITIFVPSVEEEEKEKEEEKAPSPDNEPDPPPTLSIAEVVSRRRFGKR